MPVVAAAEPAELQNSQWAAKTVTAASRANILRILSTDWTVIEMMNDTAHIFFGIKNGTKSAIQSWQPDSLTGIIMQAAAVADFKIKVKTAVTVLLCYNF